jgi:hypothetical protein
MEDLRLHLSNAFSFSLYRGDGTLRREDFSYAFEITRHAHCILSEGNPFEAAKNLLIEMTSGEK